ncbi:WD40/YVTN/BNR-like repeat-containing protein [Xanthomonas medicagonis]|uniref:WD40/YVTN/BNR-like repeat-containing protein n=1 Tax=Xanthomonas medicagonis TaxID=3160841 RepID=UPI00351354F2
MSNELSFLSGFMQGRGIGRVIAQIDALKDHGATETLLLKWDRAQCAWFYFELGWHATRVCFVEHTEPTLLAVGPDGLVSVSTADGASEEVIDASADGPSRRGPIRDLRVIAGVAYVVGMGRQVYRREADGQWTRQDHGTVLPRGEPALCGFNAIDGLSEERLYAVGFNGEIWLRHRGQWQQQDSPTPLVLHRVRVIRDDLVYACGQMGTLLRSDGMRWQRIEHDATRDDFWGMEWFNGELYLACDSGLFKLDSQDHLVAVDMQLSPTPSCRHLHASDGVLWSCGPKHVVWTEDGQRWIDVTL